MSNLDKIHNLNIHMYSLQEVLGLFDLKYDITIDELKRAKKKVLMTHPDKSGLKPEYFLFYKKAFDIVVHFYEQQQRENRVVPTEEQKYVPINTSGLNSSASKKVASVVKEMSSKEFSEKFNKLFEENMAKRPDESRNDWFKDEKPTYSHSDVKNIQGMNEVFNRVKSEQSSRVLAQYRGVEDFCRGGGSNLYDELEESDQYVVCDPFSKLKYDDLRKVHKDQTFIAVSEKDYDKMPKYSSVDHLMQSRGKDKLTPLEKAQAEKMLEAKEREYREKMMQLGHRSGLKTMEYEEKNKSVIANFLRLK